MKKKTSEHELTSDNAFVSTQNSIAHLLEHDKNNDDNMGSVAVEKSDSDTAAEIHTFESKFIIENQPMKRLSSDILAKSKPYKSETKISHDFFQN